MSFVFLYAGHFLLPPKGEQAVAAKPVEDPVRYSHLSFETNGHKQNAYMLEIDLSGGKAEVRPVLSFDSVFGFETLSSMAEKSKAFAAVNAGFFTEYGHPVGMVMINGELITPSSGRYPVLTVDGGKADLRELKTQLSVVCNDSTFGVNSINTEGKPGEAVLYNSRFGSDNRVDGRNTTLAIRDGIIEKIEEKSGATNIPRNGMLLTFFEPYADTLKKLGVKAGDKLKFEYRPYHGKNAQGYECGSWIVRNGAVVIGKYDPWIGVTTNNDPRTAVGIKKDGRLVLVTIDGRQPGYSAGFTGKELGEFLLSKGVDNAAMLDGGASAEMIVGGKVVNRPSYGGEERLLGGGLVVTVHNDE